MDGGWRLGVVEGGKVGRLRDLILRVLCWGLEGRVRYDVIL